MKKSNKPVLIGGRTIEDWDNDWKHVAGGFAIAHPELRGMAGLYRAIEDGKTVFIGKGAGRPENRLLARLNDLKRPGDSGRNYPGGRFIYANRDTLQLKVLIVGNDKKACDTTDKLLHPMLTRYEPRENASVDIVAQAVQRDYEKRAEGSG